MEAVLPFFRRDKDDFIAKNVPIWLVLTTFRYSSNFRFSIFLGAGEIPALQIRTLR